MRLEKWNQAASGDDLLHRSRQGRHFPDGVARRDRDASTGKVDLDDVVLREPAEVALDRRQTVVDAIAEELAPEGLRDDRRHAESPHDVHCLLARRVVTEIPPCDDDVSLCEAGGESRRELLERMLR